MSLPAFSNPVVGYIRPRNSGILLGSFEVTSTFAEHVASGRGPGVDLGDGQCGSPVFAMDAGTVSLAGLLGAAQVIRIQHANGYESGYAHLASMVVSKGQLVKRGQLIGTVGSTGATACHLHLGMKLNGVEIDSYPLLLQVQQEGSHIAAALNSAQSTVTLLSRKIATARAALT